MKLNENFKVWCEANGVSLMPFQEDAAEDIIRLATVREMVPCQSGMSFTLGVVERFLKRRDRNPFLSEAALKNLMNLPPEQV